MEKTRDPEVQEDQDRSCAPGSIEQQLDMCEKGAMKGDAIARREVGLPDEKEDKDPTELPEITERMAFDMSEPDREGDEASGDDHSSGLQGEESELEEQPHIDTGVPGDETRHEELETEERRRKTAA